MGRNYPKEAGPFTDYGQTIVMGTQCISKSRTNSHYDCTCLGSSFEQYCDFSRQFDPTPSPAILPDGTAIPVYTGPGVDTFIQNFGRQDLLDYSKPLVRCFHYPDLTISIF